jgi:DNA-binding CsgD family transcriptional regulator
VAALEGIARICAGTSGERALRAAVLAEVRRAVPFDAYAWLLTDPETCVGTAPLAQVPTSVDLPTLVRLKYQTPTNRWTALRPGVATSLLAATGGGPSRSPVWRELLAGYGITDIASLVFADQHGCWGWLDLWRADGPFTAAELTLLGGLDRPVTPALRRTLAAAFTGDAPATARSVEPVVMILSADLQPITQTPLVDAHLRALLPTGAGREPIPAAAYNVAAQLLARERGIDDHPPYARAHLGDGVWITLSAARFGTSPTAASGIAVSIEPTPAAERAKLFARVIGLTQRESELLRHLVSGADTRELAHLMVLSDHTVQDHLKSIFAKADVRSRRMLVARATGMR